ncbi:DUF3953 domain-containing protein [Ureibacillus acetophenoni]
MLFFGAFILMTGFSELMKGRKGLGYMSIVVSLLVFSATIKGILLN